MKKIVMIVGPTGIGKTSLSIKLAKHYNTELISGDSVQVYRSLDIGSGKVKPIEMEGIKHHLIDILDLDEEYSVSDFQKNGRNLINDFESRGMLPIFVGGTGYYLRSVIFDYEFNDEKRTDKYDYLSNEEIYDKLEKLGDSSIPDIHNRQRLLRHLEILESGKEPVNKNKPLYDYLIIGLTCDREKLYQRIEKRVDMMIEEGFLDEVKGLHDKGIRSKAVGAIGYKEFYRYLDNELSYDDALSLMKQHSRNYAKRQYTWFRNQMTTNWIDVLNEDPVKKSIELIDEFLKK